VILNPKLLPTLCFAWSIEPERSVFWRTGIFGLLVVMTLLGAPFRIAAAEEAPSLAGIYRDERVMVELSQPVASATSTRYKGSIQLGEQKFPLKAEAEGNRLKGTFESEGYPFEFSGSVVGRMLVLTTDGTTYRLTKQVVNPLARAPSKLNPLAQTRTNAAPVQPPPSRTTTTLVSGQGNTMRFVRYSVIDDPAMIGGEAFSMLIPADWQVEGGLAWRLHPAVPAYIALRVSNPNRTEALEAFPAIMFVWAEGGIPLYPPGSIYLGNEVAEPLEDPVVYIKQVLLPRFRKNLPLPRFVETEELPKVAATIAETAEESGLQKKFRAARVRMEYVENGRAVQEDIYCVLGLAYAPAIQTTFWGPDRNYAFKAEKGKLDAHAKVFQTIVSSFRPNVDWFNRYVQLVQALAQTPADATRQVSEFGRYIKVTAPEITEARRQAYERQHAAQERVNASFTLYLRGVEEYRNPGDNHKVVLPAAYPGVWANAVGDYLLSDEATFNPNVGLTKDWQRVEVSR
jgi:hypothetical protein